MQLLQKFPLIRTFIINISIINILIILFVYSRIYSKQNIKYTNQQIFKLFHHMLILKYKAYTVNILKKPFNS